MPVTTPYIDYIQDLLGGLGAIRIKKMFGGAGVYCDDLYFAILADDELYFKVDDGNRADYEALGLKPFSFTMKNGRSETMSYYPLPADVLEDEERLREWAGKALEAARRAKRKK